MDDGGSRGAPRESPLLRERASSKFYHTAALEIAHGARIGARASEHAAHFAASTLHVRVRAVSATKSIQIFLVLIKSAKDGRKVSEFYTVFDAGGLTYRPGPRTMQL